MNLLDSRLRITYWTARLAEAVKLRRLHIRGENHVRLCARRLREWQKAEQDIRGSSRLSNLLPLYL